MAKKKGRMPIRRKGASEGAKKKKKTAQDRHNERYVETLVRLLKPQQEYIRSDRTLTGTLPDWYPTTSSGAGREPRYEGTPNTAETRFETQSAPRRKQ